MATTESHPARAREKVQTSVVITMRENEDSDEPVSDQVHKVNRSDYLENQREKSTGDQFLFKER